jgi:hypothetical protein
MFVVHCEPEGKPDMEFWMHKSWLYYFDPRDSEFIFVNTVSENKAGFTKRQIKEAEVTRSLYSKINYPSWKDFKWIIRSNQIKDCPVTVNHVDTALNQWQGTLWRFQWSYWSSAKRCMSLPTFSLWTRFRSS